MAWKLFRKDHRAESLSQEQLTKLACQIEHLGALISEQEVGEHLAKRRGQLRAMYGGWPASKVAQMCGKPDGVLLDRDDLPHVLDENKEDLCTMWVSLTGELYHSQKGCHNSAIYPCNVVNLGSRRPCPRCNPQVIDLEWHEKYMDVIREMRACGLPHPEVFVLNPSFARTDESASQVRYSVSPIPAHEDE